MSTLKLEPSATQLRDKRALIIGLGGLGCPASLILAQAGVQLVIADDDVVDESNLHRQVLFATEDVGRSKLDAGAERLRQVNPKLDIELVRSRFLPDNARQLTEAADIVLEGSDNYATKFLAADAAHLCGRPIVHGAAIGWRGTAWTVSGTGRPCYRCLFEDIPQGAHLSCDSAGVVGPLPGFIGALMADQALSVLVGRPRFGILYQYDAKADRLRSLQASARHDCALCGTHTTISDLDERRYLRQTCAA